jgi:hypothetical protein
MDGTRVPRGGRLRALWTAAVIAALIAGPAAGALVPAQAQTANTCLSIENNGEGINSSRQLEGSNTYVSWRYDAQITDNGKCMDGAWVATLHD